MKTLTKYIYVLAGSALMFSSCNDFLDREPLDQVTPDNFFTTENDLAAYAVKHYNFNTHSGWNIGTWGNDNHTDNQATSGYDNRWVPGEWKVSDEIKRSDDPWNFDAIRECNYFLETVVPRFSDNKISGNTTNIKHYIGEMYFLRANNYFSKLQTFGDFPIIKETLPDIMEPLTEASKREPRYKVARFILEDLDMAISMLNNSPSGGKNRITRNAALLLKSRVALYEASWLTYHKGTALVPGGSGWPGNTADIEGFDIQAEINYFLKECKSAAKEIADNIPLAQNNDMGPEHKMDNPYFAQFSDNSLEQYPEILLWRAYNQPDFGIVHSATFYIRTGGNTGFTRQFVETFLCLDGKPIYASDEYQGDASLSKVRENRDKRLQLFMMTPGELLSDNVMNGIKDTLANAPGIIDITEKRCVTGYQLRKGLSHNWYRDGNASIEGSPVYRATEAYLNYMEASCMENGGNSIDADAQKYWMALRKRAGLPEDYMITVNATDLSKESDWGVYSAGKMVNSLLYNIRRERRCELMEEGFRMYDLKRWRALDQVKNYRVEGVNLWESDLKDMYQNAGGTSNLVQEGNPKANVSSYAKSGKYLCPYRVVQDQNLLYDAGYNWCEAHYLTPISVKHFRITASDPTNVATSVIYQNPGWPTVADEGPIGIK